MNRKFEAAMDGLIDRGGPGVAVAVHHRNQAPYLAGFGLADVEWGAAITPETVFRIGSVTKQFTAAAIMVLAEEGKLGLDDPVHSVLGNCPASARNATIRHLLNHTSGIKEFNTLSSFPETADLSLNEVIELFKHLPPDFNPGERHASSNWGYILLGAIIETLSGMPYRTFLLERFFRPLQMRQTSVLFDEPIVSKRAKGIQNASTMSQRTLTQAAFGIGSTVADFLTWTDALRSGQVVSAKSYATMIEPARRNGGSLSEYGFGLIRLEFRGRTAITHTGRDNGFAAIMTHFQEDDLTVVVLSNLDSFPVERAHLALARRALDLPDPVARPRITVSAEEVARCAGSYQSELVPWWAPWTFVAADGLLTAPFPVPNSRFEPFTPTEFQCVDDPEIILRFDQPDVVGYNRVTYEGPMRSPWQASTATRVAPS